MIYEPSDDTFLMLDVLKKNLRDKDVKILEIGVGSGYILENLKKFGFKTLVGVDINSEAVKLCKEKKLNVFESNLFSKVVGKFDVIFFNPPYLPEDKMEDKKSQTATTGGKTGSKIINQFLIELPEYLEKNGQIFLLTSSLTRGVKWGNFKKTLVGEKKLFFEKLFVWELKL